MLQPGSCHSLLSYHSDTVVNPVTLSFVESAQACRRSGLVYPRPRAPPSWAGSLSFLCSFHVENASINQQQPLCAQNTDGFGMRSGCFWLTNVDVFIFNQEFRGQFALKAIQEMEMHCYLAEISEVIHLIKKP